MLHDFAPRTLKNGLTEIQLTLRAVILGDDTAMMGLGRVEALK